MQIAIKAAALPASAIVPIDTEGVAALRLFGKALLAGGTAAAGGLTLLALPLGVCAASPLLAITVCSACLDLDGKMR